MLLSGHIVHVQKATSTSNWQPAGAALPPPVHLGTASADFQGFSFSSISWRDEQRAESTAHSEPHSRGMRNARVCKRGRRNSREASSESGTWPSCCCCCCCSVSLFALAAGWSRPPSSSSRRRRVEARYAGMPR